MCAAYPVSMAPLGTLSTDYRTITEGCGLLDRSERGKLALSGVDAATFLQGQVSNDVEGLAVGAGCYAAFLTPKGKMLGDVRILNAGDELLLDTERVALQALFNMIRRFSLGYQVKLHKRTLERGLLSLIGPGTGEVAGAGELPAEEHAHLPVSLGASRRVPSAPTSGSICSAIRWIWTLSESGLPSPVLSRWQRRPWNACGSSTGARDTE